jgi:hypothetical protein
LLVGTTSGDETVTVTNTGSANLVFSGINVSSNFAIDAAQSTCSTAASVVPAGNCHVAVKFAPTATGAVAGALTLADNTPNSPQSVALSGTGTAPGVSLTPSSLTFGATVVGQTSAPLSVTLTNTGTSNLTISNLTVSGDYALNAAGTTCSTASPVAATGSCLISVTFTPAAAGTRNGTVTISDNASGGGQLVALTGTSATTAGVQLSPASLSFAGQATGTKSSAQTVTLTNTGGTALSISSITIGGAEAGEFAETNDCGTTLASGASCTISVTFAPTAGGTVTATLAVGDSAGSSPQVVSLSGSGIAPDFALSISPGSRTVSRGSTATYTLQVAPEGGFTGTVTLLCASVPLTMNCTLDPPSVTVDSTSAASATLSIATTAPSETLPLAPDTPGIPPAALWLALLALSGTIALAMTRRLQPRAARIRLIATFAALLLSVVFWASCGGGGTTIPATQTAQSGGTTQGTYTLTVTATSGSLSHSTTLNLTVN